jgi:hypothetical protein
LPEQTYVFAKILSLQRFLSEPEQLGTLFIGKPLRPPQVAAIFIRDDEGGYRPRNSVSN